MATDDDPIEVSGMEASSILEESMMDGNGSRSLRPSRRRVQKGSAVVLNADRLRRMVDNQVDHATPSQPTTTSSRPTSASPSMEYHVSGPTVSSRSSPEHQMLEALKAKPKVLRSPTERQKPKGDYGGGLPFDSPSVAAEIEATGSPRRHIKKWSPESAKLVQTLHKDMTATDAAKVICHWYKHKLTNRMDRFTQHGKWPMATAEKVHALMLGHRVRRFFKRNADIKRLIASQRDVQRVLHELVHQHQHAQKLDEHHRRFDLQEIIRQTQTQLHGADQQLALSLIKELLGDREKLNHCLFEQRVFVPFPKPGYWSLHLQPSSQSHHSSSHHHHHHPPHATVTGTPQSATRRGSHPSNRSHQSTPHRPQSQPPSQSSQLQSSTTHRPIAVAETPPQMKRAMEQQHHLPQSLGGNNSAAAPDNTGTVKVPVKLYVGHHHRSLIDDSLQHAQGMQAYLTPTTATATATDADPTNAAAAAAPSSIENSNKHKPQSLHELLESVSDSTAASATASTTASRYLEDERPIRGAALPMHTILERLHEEDVDVVEATASTTHTMATSSKRKSLRTSRAPAVASSTHVASTATAAVPSSSAASNATHGQGHAERKRQHEGCYVQLDVLSGDKLIPARKGAVTKDSVPDRKPSLKVTLYLPTLTTTTTTTAAEGSGPSMGAAPSSSSSSSLKRVAHVVRDYEELTYHPVWNASFALALPLPRALLRQLFDLVSVLDDGGAASMITSLSSTASIPASLLTVVADVWHEWQQAQQHEAVGIVQLTETQYEQLTRYLLQHWSAGHILIEVVDGERFNEDIFMGQCQLLLTSFLPAIRKLHELQLRGTYTLDKQKPTNRVSGTITVQATWHVPEKTYLEEQLTPMLQELWRKEQQHQQHHHHQQQLPVGGVKLSARTSQKMRQHKYHASQAASTSAGAHVDASTAATAAVHASPSSLDSYPDDDHDDTIDDGNDGNVHGTDDDHGTAALDRRVHQLHDFMRFFDTKPMSVSPPTAAVNAAMLPASVIRSIVQPPQPSQEGHVHDTSSGLFQSKFMQNLVASLDEHHHHHAPPSSSSSSVLRTPTPTPTTATTVASPAVPSSSIVVNAAPVPRVRPTSAAVSTPPTAASASASASASAAVKRPPLAHPTLEESDNIRLPHWSTPDAAATAATGPLNGSHARPRPRSTPSLATAATATAGSGSSSQHRRSLLAHMSKQLDVLHAVQHSAEEAVDSYGKRLQEHIDATHRHKSPAAAPSAAVLSTPVRVGNKTSSATASTMTPSTPASLPPPSPPRSLPPSLPASASRNGRSSVTAAATTAADDDDAPPSSIVVTFPSFLSSPPRSLATASHQAAYPYPTELRSPDDDDDDDGGLPRHRSAPNSRASPAPVVHRSGGGGARSRHGGDTSSGLLMLSSPSAQRWEAQDVPVYTDLYDWDADGLAAPAGAAALTADDETLFDEDEDEDDDGVVPTATGAAPVGGHRQSHSRGQHHDRSHHSSPPTAPSAGRFYDDDEDDCVSVPSTTVDEPPVADGSHLYDDYDDDEAHYGDDSFVRSEADEDEEELHVIPSPPRVVDVRQTTAAPPTTVRRASLRTAPPPPPPPPPPRVPPPPPPPPARPSSSAAAAASSLAPQTPPRSQQAPPPPSSSSSASKGGFRTTPQHASRLSAVLAQVDAALQEVQALTASPAGVGPSTGHSSAVTSNGGAMKSPSRIPKYTASSHHPQHQQQQHQQQSAHSRPSSQH